MKVVIDGFGGDHAPLSVLEGSAMAVKEYGVEIIVTGDEGKLKRCAEENNISLEGIIIRHTDDVIEICDDPTSIMKEHSGSSMAVGMKMVRDGEADAFVSAGSTGALTVGASLMVKRLRGIRRVTIASVIPCKDGCYLLADGGANLDCRPEMLVQFAAMGAIYMERVMDIKHPRVGLVNVGEEETKGRELQQETLALLKNNPALNFVGNIEARDVPLGKADVVIADGFTGNVMLKLTEGLAKFFMGMLKDVFMKGIGGKLAAALVMKDMKKMQKTMDYKEYGGAPLLGCAKPVIKAHGSSDGYALKNAIKQAYTFAEQDVNGEIAKALARMKEQETAS